MVCINLEVVVKEAGWCVLRDGVWYYVMKTTVRGPRGRHGESPVRVSWRRRCRGLSGCGVLPLLIRCGCFVSALAVFVEGDAFLRAERGEVVAAENAGFEPAGCEEAER